MIFGPLKTNNLDENVILYYDFANKKSYDGIASIITDLSPQRNNGNFITGSTSYSSIPFYEQTYRGTVENEIFNLFGSSTNFSNSSRWTLIRCSVASGYTSPIGDNTAWLVTRTIDDGIPLVRISQSVGSLLRTKISAYNSSIYLKKFSGGTGFDIGIYNVNQTAGIEPTFLFNPTGFTMGIPSIQTLEDVGNGWFRLSAFHNPNNNQLSAFFDFNGIAVGESMLIWGPQMTRGSDLKPYVPTNVSDQNGSLPYIKPQTNVNYNPTGHTIEFLVNYTSQSDTAPVVNSIMGSIGTGNAGGSSYSGFDVLMTGVQIQMRYGIDGQAGLPQISGTFKTSPLFVFKHITIVLNGLNVKLYENGNLIGEGNLPGTHFPNYDFRILNNKLNNRGFLGSLSYLKIYNKVLTESEIKNKAQFASTRFNLG